MLWTLQFGPVEAALRATGQGADALNRKPELLSGDAEYWVAFWDLDSRVRPQLEVLTIGEKVILLPPRGLPITEIEAWLDGRGVLDLDTRITYHQVLGALDNAWLEHHRKKQSNG